MKRNVFYVLFCILAIGAFSGCGASVKSESVSVQKADFSVERRQIPKELQKKYPKWFDQKGNLVYPYTYQSKEWQEASHKELAEQLLKIPQEILDAMDTVQLLDFVECNPAMHHAFYDTFDIAIEELLMFNGSEELLRRKDAYKAAYLKISERSKKEIQAIDLEADVNWEGENMLGNIRLEEYLMLSQQAYDAMTEEQRAAVMKVLEERQEVIEKKEEERPPQEHIFKQCLKKTKGWEQYSSADS